MMLHVLFVAMCAVQPPAELDQAIGSAIAVIEHQERLIRSWRLKYASTARAASLGTDGVLGEQRASFWESRSGTRYRSKLDLGANTGSSGPSDLDENSFDGSSHRTYNATAGRGSISSSDGVDYSYRNYVYMAQRPLSEMIVSAIGGQKAAWESLNGRRLLRLQLPEAHGGVRTFHLDPSEGWQPRRIVLDQPIPEGAYPDGRKREVLVMQARSFLRRDGVVIPSDVEITVNAISQSDQPTRIHERHILLKSLEVNPDIPDSEFTIQFPDGTQVSDKDRQVVFTQGKPDSERPLNVRSPTLDKAVMASGTLWIWWADPRVWLGMTAVLLAAMGVVVWRQRRA